MKKLFAISFQLAAVCAMAQVGISWQKDNSQPALAAPAYSDTSIRVFVPAIVQSAEQKIYDYQRYNHGTSPGFRVQIDFGQDRNAINKIQTDFSGKYPGITSYISYKQPYFRVSAGDFRTRLEALRFLNSVRKDYPGAFVVSDKIVPPPLQ